MHMVRKVGLQHVHHFTQEGLRTTSATPTLRKKFFVFQINGEKMKVCMKAFCAVLGITKHRLEKAKESLRSGTSMPSPDRRGRHHSRPKAVSKEAIDEVNRHILSFPSERSHYSRNRHQSTRRYLSPLLSIGRMYDLYKDWCTEKSIDPVSQRK